MKRRDPNSTLQVYPHIYSQPYYELEAWMETNPLDEEDALRCLETEGCIPCNVQKSFVGVFRTKEDAIIRMEELCEDEGEYFPYFFLRQKPLCMMMPTGTYIKEWTYEHALDQGDGSRDPLFVDHGSLEPGNQENQKPVPLMP